MGALLPTLQANHLREGLTDYLTTTFALTDADTLGALTDFVGHPRDGMFKGPYVRLRLPFAPALGNWGMHLDWWPKGFTPYGHQARAFERLSTKFQDRAQPTLVTTGTGSGKTESFLVPILDHVLRAKKNGVAGMKALIIYPMNALANDQEQRLARLIARHSELAGITAGLYTGEQSSGGRTMVSEQGLITDRGLMHDSPPDILLTNYKMLDHLLLRPDRAAMWRQSADSLQYVVLDEFHTYDGAQGTDVAMLLRRLGLTVKSQWTPESPVTEADRARPLGRITPVATSATLGAEGDPSAMTDFAHTVFGELFTVDDVISETRLTPEQWLADRDRALDSAYEVVKAPRVEVAVTELRKPEHTGNAKLTALVLATLFRRAGDLDDDLAGAAARMRRLDPVEQLDLLKGHPLFVRLLREATDAVSLRDLASTVLPIHTNDSPAARADRERYLDHLFAALSHLRAEVGRAALNVDVHLWIRELSRIDRAAGPAALFRWADDGNSESQRTEYHSAVYCRHCGRSGWGIRLAPTGDALDPGDESVRTYHLTGGPRFRALISAPAEAQLGAAVEDLRWWRVDDREISSDTPDPASAEVLEGKALPVLVLHGPDADDNSQKDVCPACRTADGIRFLGSAVATQLSVSLSSMFGDAGLDSAEKKALIFTDSVQDAAHRAGFVQARSHILSLRSTLRNALGTASAPMTLGELRDTVLDLAGDDPMRRYHLLAPDIVEHEEFTAFWRPGGSAEDRRNALRTVRRRVEFDIDLEFGLQSRLGRTLELTGSAFAEVDLGAPERIARLGAAALDGAQRQLGFSDPDASAVTRWVRGTVERMRTQGAIGHPWLDKYVHRDGNRHWVWTGRPKGEGMPAFPRGRPAPAFPAVGSRTIPEGFDAITAPSSWYARWAADCLDVAPFEGGALARSLFAVLAEDRIASTVTTEKDLTVYVLGTESILVGVPEPDALKAGDHQLVCDVCQTPTPGSRAVVDQLDGAPCLLVRCPGRLRRAPRGDNFYRRLYSESEMKRVVAREHTSLLPTATRLEYETAFKNSDAEPSAPNVLVATPTLEMGIDIGDLSTVMLGSLPRTVSSYLQRVGRAGRLTGNALALAFVRGRGEHLPKLYEPTSVIQGQVRPPATFLDAEEILRRQYVAHIVDLLARRPGAMDPHKAAGVLGGFDDGSWMAALIDTADGDARPLLDGFLGQFGDLLSEAAIAGLRAWATPAGPDEPSDLATHLREAVHRWRRDVAELTERRTAVDAAMPEFERRANSPAATEDDRRDLRTARGTLRLLGAHIRDLTEEHWVGVLERYGVLPNYTLLDDAVTLDVGITWIDPETNDYAGDTASYRRGSRVALTELAPGATFYAQGLAVQIDAVDLGADAADIHTWQVCPQCGWVRISHAAEDAAPLRQCPRCGTGAIADIAQQMHVLEMSRVSAEVRRDEASITDNRDERAKESFRVVTAADIDPDEVVLSWYVEDYEFGAEYLRHMDIRWLNVGRRGSQGARRTIAGEETTTALFRVCSGCGQLDKVAGRNQPHEHRAWCRFRKAADENHVREIALARTLSTQAVLLHLPGRLEYDSFAHPSLSAALLLGLREVIGGAPQHLDVAVIADALHAPQQRALLLHDTVPGGTGYLAELADPHKVWSVLHAARAVVAECACAHEDRLACHHCLLPFATPQTIDKVSRTTALTILDDLLGITAALGTSTAPGTSAALGTSTPAVPSWEQWTARLTRQSPAKRPTSEESPLERRFYQAFIGRLKTFGATVTERPGTYGPSAIITMPGDKIRRWTLIPQVPRGDVRPDFELTTPDPAIPEILIFADGRRFHAVPGKNRVAKDAEQRAKLRSSGRVVVWSFSHDDLENFRANKVAPPRWHSASGAKVMMQRGNLKPDLVKLLSADPVTQLLAFMSAPDREDFERVGSWLPMMFLAGAPARGDNSAIAAWALDLLDGKDTAPPGGHYACWSYRDGPLTVTAAFQPPKVAAAGPRMAETMTAVLALDDRDDHLDREDGRFWKDWLRLSNWFGLRDGHLVTTRSLLAADSVAPEQAADTTGLSPQWQQLHEMTMPGLERELVTALAEANAPLPQLGVETDDGAVIDLSWPERRVAVLLDDDGHTAARLSEQGWTICPPDAVRIIETLAESGVR
ncbi:DEAD/DEAH box helicase [Nocardia bovistercoris]|uniref:DEAD/DEAH box helicase n=1 Tax=Nocardia bovistercoris TaxID=2785916 RepID=A0A931IDC3_9NOCA|nr:DEAD/DEAH box helicase [Nocardia bovistercoris]MBH0779339.1 DEAD/DEAH box helicase [Nocardia bovistercoris]